MRKGYILRERGALSIKDEVKWVLHSGTLIAGVDQSMVGAGKRYERGWGWGVVAAGVQVVSA